MVELGDLESVSICVLNYNGLKFLKLILTSLMRTNYPQFEIIMIDNGSSDDSVLYVRTNFPSVKIVHIKENRGIGAALNVGLAAASGKFVSFLNNDMEVDPNWLLPLVLTLKKFEKAAGCDSKYLDYFERDIISIGGGAGRIMDRYGNVIARGANERDKGQYNNQIKVFECMSLFKKNMIKEAGGFDELCYIYFEETDLCWRLHRMGYDIIYVPDSKIYHITGGTLEKSQKGKKRIKNEYLFHFHKNKLMILLKNNPSLKLFYLLPVYIFDIMGYIFYYIYERQQLSISIIFKGIIWNNKNLRIILQNKKHFINENMDNYSYLPYSGIWKAIIDKLVS